MPLFLSDEEFERSSLDANAVAEKADAASITAEQTCALLEQKFVALSNEHNVLQLKLTEFNASVDGTAKRIAEVEADKQRVQLNSVDIEKAWEAVKHAKKPRIHTFIATSEIHMQHKLKKKPEEVVEIARSTVKYARDLGCKDVEFSPEDAANLAP